MPVINTSDFAIATFCLVNVAVAGVFPLAMESCFNLAVAEVALVVDNRDAANADRAPGDRTTERPFSFAPAFGAPFESRKAIGAASGNATSMMSTVGFGLGSLVEPRRVVARGPLGDMPMRAGPEAASASFAVTGMATPTSAVVGSTWPVALIAVAGIGLGAYARWGRQRRAALI